MLPMAAHQRQKILQMHRHSSLKGRTVHSGFQRTAQGSLIYYIIISMCMCVHVCQYIIARKIANRTPSLAMRDAFFLSVYLNNIETTTTHLSLGLPQVYKFKTV